MTRAILVPCVRFLANILGMETIVSKNANVLIYIAIISADAITLQVLLKHYILITFIFPQFTII